MTHGPEHTTLGMETTGRLRILHVASGDLWGGAEAQIYGLLRQFRNAHPELSLVIALLNEGDLSKRLRELDLEVVVLNERHLSSREILSRLIALARTARPNLIHTHRQKENVFGSIAALACRAQSLRTVHGAPEFVLTDSQMAKKLFRFLNRFTARHLQAVSVAVSSELASRMPTFLPGAKFVTINNGIDVEAFKQQPFAPRSPHSPVRVCFVGRLVAVKRLDVFLHMASKLEQNAPGRYEFHIIGDGPMRQEIEAIASDLRIDSACHFHGFTDEVSTLLTEMDVLVLTSDHEGLPMTALEALALGLPVVAHAVGGLPELLSAVKECRLVQSQDPDLFAQAVASATLITSSQRGRSLLPEPFHIAVTAKQYVRLYRQLSGKA